MPKAESRKADRYRMAPPKKRRWLDQMNRDADAPGSLTLELRAPTGELWGSITAPAKVFSTGSVGFYGADKIANPKNGGRYQVGGNIIPIGSKRTQGFPSPIRLRRNPAP